eukprot:SAG11_NODE_9066_length_947_cov_6.797170_1_plen_267_part_10
MIQLRGIGSTSSTPIARIKPSDMDTDSTNTRLAFYMDSDWNQIEMTANDEVVKTGMKVTLTPMSAADELTSWSPSNGESLSLKSKAALKGLILYEPSAFVGRDVYRRCSIYVGDTDEVAWQGVAHGKIAGLTTRPSESDPEVNATYWEVCYDDDTREEYDAEDLIKFCIDTVDGTEIDEPYRGDEHEPEVTPAHKPSSDAGGFLLTEDGDTFETVCNKLGVQKTMRRAYYDAISAMNYGHKHNEEVLDDDNNIAGHRFGDPFNKKSK